MLRIDTHQHFWLYNPVKDAWITDDMSVIQKDFLSGDIAPVLQYNDVAGCIAVQADQTEMETMFLLELAERNPFIAGVVGWVDLKADNLEERLAYFKQYKKLKGFRHILQAEPAEFMLEDKFKKGISKLNKYGYTYDLLIKPQHLKAAEELVSLYPNQRFVIDHMAKPLIKDKHLQPWADEITRLAACQNVYCKISGLLTEADWYNWQPSDFTAYLDVVFKAFGPSRIMFGSDWPVCMVAGGYNQFVKLLEEYLTRFTTAEQTLFWSENAINFYGLSNTLHKA
ncbi:amidohydrolase family protein [Mucilaginibacter sp. KACC 22063]|uniref:amidohydrolase family protein n=1 Tax=Mucilaginibacter sp. KACC 22063 TaxID=3025666 RepID=UPI0023665920|nr:amidohydrolase family protein [Mucilaginibacter sp. KACC 22063]WDF53830.1 amidohydrolase family protein [Mucilaginibacter sp. KACC 22063]